jgi:hypothetical protein
LLFEIGGRCLREQSRDLGRLGAERAFEKQNFVVTVYSLPVGQVHDRSANRAGFAGAHVAGIFRSVGMFR